MRLNGIQMSDVRLPTSDFWPPTSDFHNHPPVCQKSCHVYLILLKQALHWITTSCCL